MASEAKSAQTMLAEISVQIDDDIREIKQEAEHQSKQNAFRTGSRGRFGYASKDEFVNYGNVGIAMQSNAINVEIERSSRYDFDKDAGGTNEPRKQTELFQIVKINRILNIAKLGMQVKK